MRQEPEDAFRSCILCPRQCKVDRCYGKRGICHMDSRLVLARAALHMWEEPCISGKKGSGAVFFSGCPLGCVYCQNRQIAQGYAGVEIPQERLGEIFLELQGQGAHNINLVTACHYVPYIVQELAKAKSDGLTIPIVYNSSGYESLETLKRLDGLVDVYLPDFKYMDAQIAQKYSHARDYPEAAKRAIEEMVRQTCGEEGCLFDEEGMLLKGVIVRHLLLPGHVNNAKEVVSYLYHTYGDRIYLSLMSQYTPMSGAVQVDPLLGRKVTYREYDRLVRYALDLGVTNAFIQEGETAKESFIPAFDGEGVGRRT